MFFKQILGKQSNVRTLLQNINFFASALSKRGYRVLAASWPVYWTHEAWCHGLAQLLDQLGNNQSGSNIINRN